VTRIIKGWFVSAVATALLAVSVASGADLPAGASARIRLMDYVNSEHQPLGYTFRGTVEGSVTVGDEIIVPDKSRVLMRLVADPETAGGLTVEWWAVKFGDDWFEFRGAAENTDLFTRFENIEDHRLPQSDARPLASRGSALNISFNTMLRFEIRRPVHLLEVGRFRF
jgi:hypothetical protein